jgi:hypothetical protein
MMTQDLSILSPVDQYFAYEKELKEAETAKRNQASTVVENYHYWNHVYTGNIVNGTPTTVTNVIVNTGTTNGVFIWPTYTHPPAAISGR